MNKPTEEIRKIIRRKTTCLRFEPEVCNKCAEEEEKINDLVSLLNKEIERVIGEDEEELKLSFYYSDKDGKVQRGMEHMNEYKTDKNAVIRNRLRKEQRLRADLSQKPIDKV